MRKKREKKLKEEIISFVNRKPLIQPVEFISTGCIPLNLALSQKGEDGGIARNRIFNIVGDKSSGKTLLALEICFWFFQNIKKINSLCFGKAKEFEIIYNNREKVMDFDLELMYGKEFVGKIGLDKGLFSTKTIEGFGKHFANKIKEMEKGQSILYVVDTWDALSSEEGERNFDKAIKRGETKEKAKGSYNLEKPKYSSQFFSKICDRMTGKDVTLVIVSQAKKKIGVLFGEQNYRAGEGALDYYCHQVLWLSEIKRLKKSYDEESRVYAIKSKGRVKKNKISKPFREAEFQILFDHGIDNISSCLDFLFLDKKIIWKEKEYRRRELIEILENNEQEMKLLYEKVEDRWKLIEEKTNMSIGRKRKYE